MTSSNDDLWPAAAELTEEPADKAPLLILRDQAVKLGIKTSSIVEAKVLHEPSPDGSSLDLEFILIAPALGYEYVLLRAVQPVDLYPVTLEFEGNKWVANDEAGFKRYLESLFKSARTRKISSLLAQSKSA